MRECKNKKKLLDNSIFLSYRLNKIVSIIIVSILILTAFSSTISANENTRIGQDDDNNEKENNQRIELRTLLKDFLIERREIIPLHIVTKYNGTEKTTKMRLFLPTAVDIDGDRDLDIRVWVLRLPGIDLRPPALCMKTTLIINRLSGMDEDMLDDHFEIYIEYMPRIVSRLSQGKIDRIRLGYQSPAGEEIPNTCKIIHKYVPHALHLRYKPTHTISMDPG